MFSDSYILPIQSVLLCISIISMYSESISFYQVFESIPTFLLNYSVSNVCLCYCLLTNCFLSDVKELSSCVSIASSGILEILTEFSNRFSWLFLCK